MTAHPKNSFGKEDNKKQISLEGWTLFGSDIEAKLFGIVRESFEWLLVDIFTNNDDPMSASEIFFSTDNPERKWEVHLIIPAIIEGQDCVPIMTTNLLDMMKSDLEPDFRDPENLESLRAYFQEGIDAIDEAIRESQSDD